MIAGNQIPNSDEPKELIIQLQSINYSDEPNKKSARNTAASASHLKPI